MNDKVLKIIQKIFNIISILGMIACVIGGYFLYRIGILQDPKALSELVMAHYLLGPFIFIGLQIIQVVIPIIPGGITTAAGVMIFGPYKGFLYNYLGTLFTWSVYLYRFTDHTGCHSNHSWWDYNSSRGHDLRSV